MKDQTMPKTFRPRTLRLALPILILSGALALAGCDSPEEKAEAYFQSAMKLIEAGDTARAAVEFRNVFKYNGFHKEARAAYAAMLLEEGNTADAYSQYLRLIEQYPDTPEARITLAELAMARGDWQEVERHGRAAAELTPEDPRVKAIMVALDYRDAVIDKDDGGRERAARAARALLDERPENMVARRVSIDYAANNDDPQRALEDLDAALEIEPDSLELNVQKFRLLVQAGDREAAEAQLRRMYERFPDNEQVRTSLIQWYMALGNFTEAEAFLRELAGADTAAPEGHVAVVQLLRQAQGEAAALAELDRLIAANAGNENADLYGALRAAILFERGDRSDAIAAMETILQDAEPSDQTRRIKVMLARMLAASGNQVGARARVEEVLAEDDSNSDALKMRAAWAIEDDKADQAIIDLRAALDQNPRDAQTLTLLSQANERLGNLELAGERLSQAVEVSGAAPDETLRYVRFLRREGRNSSVASLLLDALRANPAHVGLLTQLADFYLSQGQWERAQDAVARLSALDDPAAQRAAEPLQAAILLAQNRTEEGVAFLQSLAGSAGEGTARGTAAVASVVQTQLRAGQPEAARDYVDERLAEAPNDPGLRLISGSLYAVMGDLDKAEAIYRELVAERPEAEAPVRLLYGLLEGEGRSEEAGRVLEAGIAAQPGSVALRLLKASRLERQGDIEGAIAVYEALYEENSNNVLVANNLASLITSFRDSPEDLERAFAIARRLSSSTVPAFQDTYGWIEYRRGNPAEALRYLEPAAEGLPDDPLVQLHLGMTYAALERTEEARAALTRALEIAGENSTLPQMQTARETLAKLP